MAKKGPQKFDKKRAAVTADEKNYKKSIIFKGFSKKDNFEKKLQNPVSLFASKKLLAKGASEHVYGVSE